LKDGQEIFNLHIGIKHGSLVINVQKNYALQSLVMMEGYLHKVVFSLVCNVELVNLSFKEMKFWTLAKK
jgi:hypothetical protein